MLAPLLLLWPMSVALTWLVAQNIANKPFDRELGEMTRVLAKQVVLLETVDGEATANFTLPSGAAEILHTDQDDEITTRCSACAASCSAASSAAAAARRGSPRCRARRTSATASCTTATCASATSGWRCGLQAPRRAWRWCRWARRWGALAPGHRDHQGRDPAAVRDPAAGGAAGLAGAGARHRAAQRAAAAHPPPRQQRPLADRHA